MMNPDLTREFTSELLELSKPSRTGRPTGYAAAPGSGPLGQSCKSCRHMKRVGLVRAFRKCDLMREFWDGSRKSDVNSSSPACCRWAPK